MQVTLRTASPSDYDAIVGVVDEWWGRPIADLLPRLFLDHFWRTSTVAESPEGARVGFLVGILSPSDPEQAYIHFVGIAPESRGLGLGRRLYERFFETARDAGCRRVGAVTSPTNSASIAFHRRMGFTVKGPVPDYDGPGNALIVFDRPLER